MSLTRKQKNIRKRWVAELRSGKYKQGESRLRRIVTTKNKKFETFCCLGVLCELAVRAKVIPKPVPDPDKSFEDEGTIPYSFAEEVAYLPEEVRVWAGLNSNRGEGYDDAKNREIDLTELNDEGVSFKRIATIIEKTDGLFV